MYTLRYRGIAGTTLLLACCLAGQARALSNGPNSPGAVFNDVSFGSVAWTSPSNAQASDDTYASVSPGVSNSNYLEANNFNISVPASAIIEGIEVGIEKRCLSGSVSDARVRIVKGGVVGATDRSAAGFWPTVDTVVTYGGTSDLWGDTWTAADVNASGFGVALSVTDGALDSAAVDHITMTVHFTLCDAAPLAGCRTSSRGLLMVRDNADNNKDKIVWKLTNAASTTQTEFSDPTASTLYAICWYENGALMHGVTVPPSLTLWAPITTVGFKFKDLTGASAEGIQRIILRGSTDNRSKVIVRGKGALLPDPVPPLTLPVLVQLVNGDSGICWEGTFDTPNIKRNEAGIFKSVFAP